MEREQAALRVARAKENVVTDRPTRAAGERPRTPVIDRGNDGTEGVVWRAQCACGRRQCRLLGRVGEYARLPPMPLHLLTTMRALRFIGTTAAAASVHRAHHGGGRPLAKALFLLPRACAQTAGNFST